jgi:hypothetical protein
MSSVSDSVGRETILVSDLLLEIVAHSLTAGQA